ncbi:uncharacterized protein IUM83_01149 [Phytophthora cinnamomi]|uniref:uncharacterized protein n=1 Tax=Phytophthora cinnamomi TaxID=4785 RepID=UPI00355AA1FE|nr:hypothetical protein IUM83_01149 [Phytophthora cinnamomi]
MAFATTTFCLPSTLAAAMLLATANGHGYMTEPAVTFLSSSTDNTQFIATIESSASGFSGSFSGSPADNTAAFTKAFEASSYTSLKELINAKATVTVTDATLTCGSCNPDETAQPLPETYVEWSHSSTEGFTSSHEGPCEVWCDDVRVFQDNDCAADYTSAPAELPYDRDACLGTTQIEKETTTKMSPTGLATLLVLAVFGSQRVSGHGYLVQPLAKFISPNIDKTQYSSTIDSYKLFPDGTFNTDPTINVKSFVENYKKSKYKSVRAMIEDNQVLVSNDTTASCGFSDPAQTSYGALNDTVYWGRNDDITLDEGFVHMGPCEVWYDDNRAQQDMNCHVTYTPASSKGAAPVPIDNSVCTSAIRLTFYWVAMHVNCVNINGGTGSASSSTTAATATTTTTTTTPPSTSNTSLTAATTSTSGSDEQTTTDTTEIQAITPTATTATPAATPASEVSSTAGEASTTTTTEKCNVRRRSRD